MEKSESCENYHKEYEKLAERLKSLPEIRDNNDHIMIHQIYEIMVLTGTIQQNQISHNNFHIQQTLGIIKPIIKIIKNISFLNELSQLTKKEKSKIQKLLDAIKEIELGIPATFYFKCKFQSQSD